MSADIYRIEYEDGLYFVISDELLVYGFGETIEEATNDFHTHVVHFANYWSQIQDDKLTENARKMKEMYGARNDLHHPIPL